MTRFEAPRWAANAGRIVLCEANEKEAEIDAQGDDVVADVAAREGFAVVGIVRGSGEGSGHRPPRIPR